MSPERSSASPSSLVETWGRLVVARPWAVLAASLALAVPLLGQLGALQVDSSDDAYLDEDDPARRALESFRARFGGDDMVAVMAEVPPAATHDVFDPAFLTRLRALHRDLEASVPHLLEVTSLVNARNTFGRGDELVVEDLLADWPKSEADWQAVRERALANPLYRGYLFSRDARAAALMLELETIPVASSAEEALAGFEAAGAGTANEAVHRRLDPVEVGDSIRELQAVVARHHAEDFRLFLVGGPVAETALLGAMQRDIAIFVSSSVAAIALLLFVLFHRLSGVLLPLGIVGLSLLCTLGSMAALAVPITLPVQVLPSFLLAVGVCDSVHLMTIFYRALAAGESREDSVLAALSHAGVAVVLTSLTTMGGLLSFVTAEILPVVHFGLFGPLGVLFALIFSLSLLPALLVLLPLRPRAKASEPVHAPAVERLLVACGRVAARRPGLVAAASAALAGAALAGVLRLGFSHDSLSWLPEETPVRLAIETFDRSFQGSLSLELLIDTGADDGLHDPAQLARLDALAEWARTLDRPPLRVAFAVSVADVVKEIHQALHENRAEQYRIPDDTLLVAQELLLFENAGSDDLEDLVDSRFRLAAFRMRIPEADSMLLEPFLEEIEAHATQLFGTAAKVTSTGNSAVAIRTYAALIPAMAQSYAIAFLAVTPLMVLLLGSWRRGLLSMLPNLFPVWLTLGLMGWLGMPLDLSTMMIGAIVLGVAVDDTIHFMHVFRREQGAGLSASMAIERTLATTGRAMLFTSIVLIAGFGTFLLASMGNLVVTGLLTTFAIATAFLADVLISPALLVWCEPWWSRSGHE